MWLFLDITVKQLTYRTIQSCLLSRGDTEAEERPYLELVKLQSLTEQSLWLPLFLTPPASSGGSKTNLSLNRSWEGLPELPESIILMTILFIYY